MVRCVREKNNWAEGHVKKRLHPAEYFVCALPANG